MKVMKQFKDSFQTCILPKVKGEDRGPFMRKQIIECAIW